jgi:hypothetical protein
MRAIINPSIPSKKPLCRIYILMNFSGGEKIKLIIEAFFPSVK